MSEFLEIERKFTATADDWEPFIKLCQSKGPAKELEVTGPDSYFIRDNTVLRWRHSEDLSQLTIKERLSKRSSLVRAEYEVELIDPKPRAVLAFIRAAGFKKLFRIRKHCRIFWYLGEGGIPVNVVIYKVSARGHADRHFIEIEAEKGEESEASKKAVSRWAKELGLPTDRQVNSSLYELYSRLASDSSR